MRSRKTLRISFIPALLFILIFTSSCSLFKPALNGEVLEPLAAAPDFSLPDQNGNLFRLADAPGQVTLLFFGFTNCVDECPTTLAHIKLALGILEDASHIRVVLVSTDPVRDTPQALQDFLLKFDPAYLGITGHFNDVEKIWDAYGVTVLDGGETHSSFVYVVDQQGNLRLRFDAETSPEDMAADLKTLLASK